MKYVFKNTRFVTTAVKAKSYPVIKDDAGQILPEIAVADVRMLESPVYSTTFSKLKI